MPLARVFRFLCRLVTDKWWGEVTIKFKAGVIGHVEARSSYTLDTLPDVVPGDTAALQLLTETAKGVGSPT